MERDFLLKKKAEFETRYEAVRKQVEETTLLMHRLRGAVAAIEEILEAENAEAAEKMKEEDVHG